MIHPSRITLSQLSERMRQTPSLRNSTRYYSEEGLILSLGMQGAIRSLLRPQSPYLIDDYRFGIVVDGTVHGRINLIEYDVQAGSLVYITPGSFLEPLDVSDNLLIVGLGISQEMFHLANRSNIPPVFNGRLKHGIYKLDESQLSTLRSLYETFWNLLQTGKPGQETKYCMIAAIMNHVNDICISGDDPVSVTKTSANAIFDRFIRLVNMYAGKERRLSFYADKLCITERYLGTVVRQVSGITAKEWIDRAVITLAKVMLRHGDLQISRIADELNFPNPGFFCKYFRRLVDCTPQNFRNQQ